MSERTAHTLRNKKLSLYHHIKTVILPTFGWIEEAEGTDKILDVVNPATLLYSLPLGKDIVYATAPSGATQEIVIYDDGNPLPTGTYSVDYLEGQVTLDNLPSGVLTADYFRYTVSVIDSFPDDETFEQSDLPLVSIDVAGQEDTPFAIAVASKFWHMDFYVDIWATNDGMRLDLANDLQYALAKWIPIINFDDGHPIDYDGSLNHDFDISDQFLYWNKLNGKVRLEIINLPDTSEKERFRASLSGTITNIL